jgi:hypothetical protein
MTGDRALQKIRPTETICDEINACTKKMHAVERRAEDLRDTRKALVHELREAYPDSWVSELKARCQIGRSQAFKIAAIADGRTTEEKEREKNAAAVRRHRAGRAVSPLHPASNGLEETSNAVDPQASADEREAAYVEPPAITIAEEPVEPEPRKITMALPRPAPDTPEDLAAELMLLVGEVLQQYPGIDPSLARAELVRRLTEVDAPTLAPGNGGVDTSAEPPKPKRGRPPGSKNQPKAA